MRRLLFEISYAGTRYHGYQVQQNGITVAEAVQDAVERVFPRREAITGCSRTDAGVHARQFYFHMDTEAAIPEKAAVIALNNLLPDDISVKSCREVAPDFHARYNVCWKRYCYEIWNHPVKNPFLNGLAMYHKAPLDAALMDQCAREFVGTHDFALFRTTGGKDVGTIRTIYEAKVERQGEKVIFSVCGDGFLYHMVRLMTGTLLLAALGRLAPGDITAMLETGRGERGITAPAAGLYLDRVSYEPWPETSLTGGDNHGPG